LKYRAFEMVLMLFYVEHLKETLIGAIQGTDHWVRTTPRITAQSSKKFLRAVAALVEDGVVSEQERDDITALVNFRNEIAHNIQTLTIDVSRDPYARSMQQFRESSYDYGALKRIKALHNDLDRRMQSKYVHVLSMQRYTFRAAEKTYEAELKRLRKKIESQLTVRRKRNSKLKDELSLTGTDFVGENYPSHPANMSRSGNLTKRGVEVCFRLFDLGKSALAVATLMFISLKAARARRKQWLKAGGTKRHLRLVR
jgi:hypothetical protein